MMEFETLLNKEIEYELGDLGGLELGSETYKVGVDGLTKLCDRAIELKKFKTETELKQKQQKIDAELRAKQQKIDAELRAEQLKDERKDRIVKNTLTAAGIGIPAVLTVWGTLKSIEFEKEGTITTIMGRGFIQKLLPKK